MLLATTDSSPTYQSAEGYGQCASWCIGTPGVVSFNWILYPNGAITCECLRKVSERRILKSVAKTICWPSSAEGIGQKGVPRGLKPFVPD